MAKASTFTRTIRKEQVPGHVELKMTPEEASVLTFVLNRVGAVRMALAERCRTYWWRWRMWGVKQSASRTHGGLDHVYI